MTWSALPDCFNVKIFLYKTIFNKECPQKFIVEKSQNYRFQIVKECYFTTGPRILLIPCNKLLAKYYTTKCTGLDIRMFVYHPRHTKLKIMAGSLVYYDRPWPPSERKDDAFSRDLICRRYPCVALKNPLRECPPMLDIESL